MIALPQDGLVVFVKRACPTCEMIAPVMQRAAHGSALTVVTQDDPGFPAEVANVIDDRELDLSYLSGIEFTPTLIRFQEGREVERVEGWDRPAWRRLTGLADAGGDLPESQPG
jgi:thiol-disulfide isomerase/thioredoxin